MKTTTTTTKPAEPNPATHLTLSENGWTLIHQGQPLTADDRTLAECRAIATRANLHIFDQVWSAAKGTWQSMGELTFSK